MRPLREEDVADAIDKLSVACRQGRPMSADEVSATIDLWYHDFRRDPAEALAWAAAEHRRESNFFPGVAQIWSLIERWKRSARPAVISFEASFHVVDGRCSVCGCVPEVPPGKHRLEFTHDLAKHEAANSLVSA